MRSLHFGHRAFPRGCGVSRFLTPPYVAVLVPLLDFGARPLLQYRGWVDCCFRRWVWTLAGQTKGPRAPTIAVSPNSAIGMFKVSVDMPVAPDVSLCCSTQTVPFRVNTYAAPRTPISNVSPEVIIPSARARAQRTWAVRRVCRSDIAALRLVALDSLQREMTWEH